MSTLSEAAASVFAPSREATCADLDLQRRAEIGTILLGLWMLLPAAHGLRGPLLAISGGVIGGLLVAASSQRACGR